LDGKYGGKQFPLRSGVRSAFPLFLASGGFWAWQIAYIRASGAGPLFLGNLLFVSGSPGLWLSGSLTLRWSFPSV